MTTTTSMYASPFKDRRERQQEVLFVSNCKNVFTSCPKSSMLKISSFRQWIKLHHRLKVNSKLHLCCSCGCFAVKPRFIHSCFEILTNQSKMMLTTLLSCKNLPEIIHEYAGVVAAANTFSRSLVADENLWSLNIYQIRWLSYGFIELRVSLKHTLALIFIRLASSFISLTSKFSKRNWTSLASHNVGFSHHHQTQSRTL